MLTVLGILATLGIFAGLISIARPLRFLGIRSRPHALAVIAVAFVVLAATSEPPAQDMASNTDRGQKTVVATTAEEAKSGSKRDATMQDLERSLTDVGSDSAKPSESANRIALVVERVLPPSNLYSGRRVLKVVELTGSGGAVETIGVSFLANPGDTSADTENGILRDALTVVRLVFPITSANSVMVLAYLPVTLGGKTEARNVAVFLVSRSRYALYDPLKVKPSQLLEMADVARMDLNGVRLPL